MRVDFGRQMAFLARRFADREALVNLERGRRYRFDELHQVTNRIANMIRDTLGLRRGDVYLAILENDNLSLMHHWTAFKTEATAAWTNFRDSIEEHTWQVDFVKPRVVFLETPLLDRYYDLLRARGIEIVCMDPPTGSPAGVHDFEGLVERASAADPHVEHSALADVALLRFTGGTTGRGKCAAYTVDNWLACRDAFYAHPEPLWRTDMRFLHFAPMSHGSGMMVLPCLFRGGCTVTQNTPDLALWTRHVESERITASMAVPTLLYRLLDSAETEKHDLSSLETLFYGAAPMSPAKLEGLRARFGDVFVQVYGATECCVPVTCLGKEEHATAVAENAGRLASAGRPTPGVEVAIVDESGGEIPTGETGEIWLRSRGTISGYYANAEGTAQEFENGFWKSGDLGYLDVDGFLYIVDRKKDMIVSGGFNIYAVEVEAALNAHPAVLMSAVVAIPSDEWGECVHGEVVPRAGAEVEASALIEFAKGRLAHYKAPKSIVLVAELPLSAAGKVLRRSVREKYWTGHARRVS